jgi:hypothetical protein
MPTSSIAKRISDAFATPSGTSQAEGPEQLAKYMDYARESVSESIQSCRRNTLAALLTSAAFLSFATHVVDKVDLGPIELGAESKLIVFLTSLSAYFFLEAAIKSNQAEQRRKTFAEAFKLWNKKAFDLQLNIPIAPDEPSYFAVSTVTPSDKYATQFDRRFDKIGITLVFMFMFLPYIFEIVAFIILFKASGFADWVVWLNAALCLALLSAYSMVFLADNDVIDSD